MQDHAIKIINSRNYETSCNILDKHQMLLVKKRTKTLKMSLTSYVRHMKWRI